MKSVVLTTAVLLFGLSTTANMAAQTGHLRAGAAKLDITLKQSDLMTPTDVIRDPLFARAIVVDDGRTCAVLIGFDLSKVNDKSVVNGISRAAASTGCPAENFIVSATHTHSSSTYGMEVGPPSPKEQEDYIVAVADAAKAKLVPVRVGYATAKVDLNVNREHFNLKEQKWIQEANPDGPSDKTLAVVEFMGTDNVPIGVYMNYGMHPINFFLTGVLSADFPGEAERYIEKLFGDRAVAIFSQAPEGDQNPMFGEFAASRVASGQDLIERFGGPTPSATPMRPMGTVSLPGSAAAPGPAAAGGAPAASPQQGSGNAPQAKPSVQLGGGRLLPRNPIPAERMEDYRRAIELTGANVTMMGTLIGANTMRLIRDVIQPVDTAQIWGGQETVTCPRPPRPGAPANAAPVDRNIKIGVLRIGDIYFAGVNAEIYSEIGMHLKTASPANKTIVVALANGGENGYIQSDNAHSHVTPGSLQMPAPACEEGKIISAAVELIKRSGN